MANNHSRCCDVGGGSGKPLFRAHWRSPCDHAIAMMAGGLYCYGVVGRMVDVALSRPIHRFGAPVAMALAVEICVNVHDLALMEEAAATTMTNLRHYFECLSVRRTSLLHDLSGLGIEAQRVVFVPMFVC